jgi:predicted nucleic-acid-binding protein
MTESVIYQKFIKIIKSKILVHSWTFQNISFKYFSEEAVIQKVFTQKEIDNMKKSPLYIPYESVIDYFKEVKNHYDFCELNVIISCMYDSLLIYADVINILYTTIKNYYGKGKIELNLDDLEAFISQVSHIYDASIIRKQFKTVKKFEIVIKSILKVIDKDIVPILPQPHRTLFELKKNTTFRTLKELVDDHLDFVGKDLEVLKKQYKGQNNKLYTFIMYS